MQVLPSHQAFGRQTDVRICCFYQPAMRCQHADVPTATEGSARGLEWELSVAIPFICGTLPAEDGILLHADRCDKLQQVQ